MEEDTAIAPDEGIAPEEAPTEPVVSEAADNDVVDLDELETDPESGTDDDVEQEPEEVEFNFGGNKVSVPKDAVPDEIREKLQDFAEGTWKSYTQKSQDVAEQAKSLEARSEAIQKMETLQGEALDNFSRGNALKQEIAQLQAEDLTQLWQSNPDRARQVGDAIAQRERALADIVSKVSQAETALEQTQAAEVARLIEEGERAVEKQVKGFKENHLGDVIDYAVKTMGIDENTAKSEWALNPPMAIATYKAMKFDEMQAQAKKAAKPKPADAKPVTPMKGKGGAATVNPDKMSTEQWMKARQRQLSK